MTAHARCAASAAERWFNCPGSVREAERFPRRASRAAAYGTRAHAIAAACLDPLVADPCAAPLPPRQWLGSVDSVDGYDIQCDAEMVQCVEVYLADCAGGLAQGDRVWVEMRLHEALQTLHPDLGGTADFVAWMPAARKLRVADLKTGAGVHVAAQNNAQLQVYALGALLATGVAADTVEVRIIQPRIETGDPVRSWEFPAADLFDFADRLVLAARAAAAPDAPLNAGPWCAKTFCPAAASCPAVEALHRALVATDFGIGGDVVPVSPSQVAAALDSIAPLRAKIQQLEAYAYALAESGVAIPGWKLVAKRPVRRWVDEAAAARWAEAHGIEPYARTLRSPAQIEADLAAAAPRGKKKAALASARQELESLVASVSSGSVLVPESDSRAPMRDVVSADELGALPHKQVA